MTLSFEEARRCVLEQVSKSRRLPFPETVSLDDSAGSVLAGDVHADRDYPPFPRSARDGFALRGANTPGTLRIIGEVRAGDVFNGTVADGEAVEIMTGAPVPPGADSVIMVEHVTREGNNVAIGQQVKHGDNITPQGAEAKQSDRLLSKGARIRYPEVALMASVGHHRVQIYPKPRVAIVATGDEIVEVTQTPQSFQIRNSNAHSIAVQVEAAGGEPHILPIARDTLESTRDAVRAGLQFDLLLLSGGVSAGKYDVVESVLQEFGAEFFFDRVRIQPGQPLVFGSAAGRFFFGLPGNPASTMVTFELFAKAAIQLLSGQDDILLPILWSKLTTAFRQRPGLTRFLPALLSADGAELTPVSWHGSGDMAAMTRSNAFLVTDPDREEWAAGDWMRVLVR